MFDVNDYPMKEPSLTPQNYALTELQSKEYAVTVAKLRSIIIDRAREMFGPGIGEEQVNGELVAQMPKALKR